MTTDAKIGTTGDGVDPGHSDTQALSAGERSADGVIATPEELERVRGSSYKWIALSNTTLGVLMVTINASILLIALPDIFRGINLDPLQPGNTSYLLWLIMGFLVVTAVLVVSFGRVGDMYGRVRMYNLGFAVFTIFSILLSVTWMHGSAGAMWLIIMRVLQGIGGALLFANSSAILTDAFPEHQRGLALGINGVAAIAGSFLGLLVGGLLAPVNWRMVFLVSVPFGLFGTVWAYLKLVDTGERRREKIDWWGNVTFAVGLIAVLAGITYGIQPYGSHTMGWTSPYVLTAIIGGLVVLVAFVVIETRTVSPMFNLQLFRIRAFTAGNVASLLAALGRGGLQFILIIWLQGIWLPLHGYSFESTPLWAGIYLIPLTVGFLASAPISGYLSDHFGARPFATGGMLIAALSFLLLLLLPVNFNYWAFAAILLLNGIGMGLFSSPNRAGIMNALPARMRGVGSGMAATFQNSAMVLSIGIFFSLIILGLASTLSGALLHGLTGAGVSTGDAQRAAALPPVATLFASLLGYNPIEKLLGPATNTLSPDQLHYVTGRSFFPNLIAEPFHNGLRIAFLFAIVACLVAATASYLRGGKYHYVEGAEQGGAALATTGTASSGSVSSGSVSSGSASSSGTATTMEFSPEQVTQPRQDTSRSSRIEDDAPAEEPRSVELAVIGVVRAAGDVIGDVVVVLTDLDGVQLARAAVGEDGRFGLAAPHSGTYVLVLTGQSVRPLAQMVHISGGVLEADLQVVSIRGTVVGRLVAQNSGDAVVGGTVVLTTRGAVTARSISARDGSFAIEAVPIGEHVLTAAARGGQPRAVAVRMTDSAHLEFELTVPAPSRVSGRVRAETDGRPLREARVSLLDRSGHVVAATASDQDGGYEFTDVPHGEYVVSATGYEPVEQRVAVQPGRVTSADVLLGEPNGDRRANGDGRFRSRSNGHSPNDPTRG
ncbi:MAG TPA: MFS transporter [Frankiaceae bacterium]|nr:MFS transporter [Frankiaceae bacterium]